MNKLGDPLDMAGSELIALCANSETATTRLRGLCAGVALLRATVLGAHYLMHSDKPEDEAGERLGMLLCVVAAHEEGAPIPTPLRKALASLLTDLEMERGEADPVQH